MLLASLKIGPKISLGIAAICVMFAVAVGIAAYMTRDIARYDDEVADVRAEALRAAYQLDGNAYRTLARVNGYILDPTPESRAEIDRAWKLLDDEIARFDRLAPSLAIESRARWQEAKTVLADMRQAQQKAIAPVGTADAQPAMKLLASEAAPRAASLFRDISAMIDEESNTLATQEGRNLLKTMSDVRGNFTAANADLRHYLATGDAEARKSFETRWTALESSFAALGTQRALFNNAQAGAYARLSATFAEFSALPKQMIALREGAGWNVPLNVVTTEVAPLLGKFLDQIEGTRQPDGKRAGGIKDVQAAQSREAAAHIDSSLATMTYLQGLLLIVGLATGTGVAFAMSRAIAHPVREMAAAMDQVTHGNLSVQVAGLGRKDEIGDMAASLLKLKESLADAERLRQSQAEQQRLAVVTAKENVRIKAALDSCTTNVMVADAGYNIVYMNDSLKEMMNAAEGELRKELPQFNSKRLHGENIDVFHKNPAHQRGMLDNLKSPYRTTLTIGTLKFDLIASPVFDEKGERLGTVVEWADRTAQYAREDIDRRSAAENTRIKATLDSCTTNVMVADAGYNIVYMNDSLKEMMGGAEGELRKELPQFNSRRLQGENIDVFHKNPAHQRGMLDNLKSPYRTTLTIGTLKFDLIASPVFDDQGARLGTVVEWADRTAYYAQEHINQRLAAENTRIKVALDSCSTNVMVADNDLNIVYMNDSVTATMRKAESDLRKELPQFDSNRLVGANIDIFHKNPAHQRAMLEKLSATYQTSIKVGGRTFNLIANPVRDDKGNRLGSVVEWMDVTVEKAVESEIDTLVNAAAAGNFRERISLEGKDGFMRNLADAMNRLCSTTAGALDEVIDNLKALSDGDLTRRVRGSYAGMFKDLKDNLNTTSERLNEIVSGVMSGANEVTAAASEIADGTSDLSRRTEQQASSLEETAASMEEMSSTIKQNAENASQANNLAISARTVATEGGEVVGKAVHAMSRIEESSQKISDIIGVIDEIAFQTNLLALNAAVEAARAGDAGKGFAVVASEVRSLAQRSSAAAKDIKGLIVESGGQVKDGVKLVHNAGTSLSEIVESIKRVADIISEIAAASREQSTGVEEINKAVAQMDEMTQQNSALVEENAAACRMLQEQAQHMQQRMASFTFESSGEGVRPVAIERARAGNGRAPAVKSPARKVAGAAGMQAALQANFENDSDWKEF